MEKGFHNIEQFIAFITPGHTAFHERLSIGVYRRGRTREFSPHKEKPPPARMVSIELLDAAIQGTAGFVHLQNRRNGILVSRLGAEKQTFKIHLLSPPSMLFLIF